MIEPARPGCLFLPRHTHTYSRSIPDKDFLLIEISFVRCAHERKSHAISSLWSMYEIKSLPQPAVVQLLLFFPLNISFHTSHFENHEQVYQDASYGTSGCHRPSTPEGRWCIGGSGYVFIQQISQTCVWTGRLAAAATCLQSWEGVAREQYWCRAHSLTGC